MKIAVVTVCMNDYARTSEWHNHYLEYKDDVFLHIIVDNASNEDYLQELNRLFIGSVIIKRKSNGGLTAAYNDGIRYALNDYEVDTIALIANDIKLERGAVRGLHRFLFSNDRFGMVAPIMLVKDSDSMIESFGAMLKKNVTLKFYNAKECISEDLPFDRIVDIVPGGMHLAKRGLYEVVGLQDEILFMYSDEIDMAIRINKAGYLVAITRMHKCWHQHINVPGNIGRGASAYYLQARNKLLLAHKHYGLLKVMETLISNNLVMVALVFRRAILDRCFFCLFYYLTGSVAGLFNIKKDLGLLSSRR